MKKLHNLFLLVCIILAALCFVAPTCGDDDDDDGGGDDDDDDNDDDGGDNTPDTFIGSWTVVGTLVANSAGDVPGNESIQPGYQAMDVWDIEEDGGQLLLTTHGNGQTLPGGLDNGIAVFDRTWEDSLSVPGYIIYTAAHIELLLEEGGFIGTEEITYSSYIEITGTTTPLGIESWQLEGVEN